MKCPRCSNTDPNYFYKGSRGYYCRKCIAFKRVLIKEEIEPEPYTISGDGEYQLAFELTPFQKEVVKDLITSVKETDVLLYAITGAGKGDLVIPLISEYLKEKKRVCYAISRREVVIELAERYKRAFKGSKVVKVCEGYTDELYGDLIVCTTHQLYRYLKLFDLIILDEVDAFPFRGDEVLNNIALNALNSDGKIVYSTATIDEEIEKLMNKRPLRVLRLDRRPHGKPLVRPKVIVGPDVILYMVLVYIMYKEKKQVIIFVESIRSCKKLYHILKLFFSVTLVYSSLEERNINIQAFKAKKYQFIIATSVLERGITIEGVDIVIFKRFDKIFNKAAIIQMAGRAGRSFKDPYGKVYILTRDNDKEIKGAIKEIDDANKVYLL